jgi:GNAT superfamily N-acetyltransferase
MHHGNITAMPEPEFTVTLREDSAGFERIDIDLPNARIGNVRCHFTGDTAIVYSIQIFPEFQRNGYGKSAINMLKNRFAVIIADRVRFTAREFWEKMGFKGRPDGNWEYRAPPRIRFTK